MSFYARAWAEGSTVRVRLTDGQEYILADTGGDDDPEVAEELAEFIAGALRDAVIGDPSSGEPYALAGLAGRYLYYEASKAEGAISDRQAPFIQGELDALAVGISALEGRPIGCLTRDRVQARGSEIYQGEAFIATTDVRPDESSTVPEAVAEARASMIAGALNAALIEPEPSQRTTAYHAIKVLSRTREFLKGKLALAKSAYTIDRLEHEYRALGMAITALEPKVTKRMQERLAAKAAQEEE